MSNHRVTLAIISLFAVMLSAPAMAVTETRDATGFEAIDMKGAAKLKVDVGDHESVRVEGDDTLVAQTKTEVRDNTLYIETERSGTWKPSGEGLTISVTLPRLAALHLNGGVDAAVTGLNGGDSTLTVEGAARVKAQGRLDRLDVAIDGAADTDYEEVSADDVVGTVNGVGHMRLQAHRSLTATVNGVGSIEYSGLPSRITPFIHGAGSITPR